MSAPSRPDTGSEAPAEAARPRPVRIPLPRMPGARARMRSAVARGGPALRRLFPALWARASGRAGGGVPTAAFLRRRMMVLPALAVVVLALTGAAYSDIHDRTERLRDRNTPALVDLARARTSLQLAHTEAKLRLGSGTVELGETYRSRLTEATQSLGRVAQSGALRKAQEQELRVVSGLVVGYGDKIAWAERHRETHALRRAVLAYADDMLKGPEGAVSENAEQPPPTSILDRIEELESELREANAKLAAWSPLTLTAVAAAALAAALFAFVLVGSAVFLRDRLRLVSLQLALAALPVLITPVLLALGGSDEHGAQVKVHDELDGLKQVTADDDADRRIETVARQADTSMRDATPDTWALTAGVALPVAGVGALACGVTLFLYGRAYPPARPRRKYPDA